MCSGWRWKATTRFKEPVVGRPIPRFPNASEDKWFLPLSVSLPRREGNGLELKIP
jgi:hypothetical protein